MNNRINKNTFIDFPVLSQRKVEALSLSFKTFPLLTAPPFQSYLLQLRTRYLALPKAIVSYNYPGISHVLLPF